MKLKFTFLALVLAGCGPSGGTARDGGETTPTTCVNGSARCTGTTLERCEDNAFAPVEVCSDVCDPARGCVTCVVGTGTCEGDISHACKDDGSGYTDVYCDPLQGVTCSPDTGRCVGACAPDELGNSYIGCDYYPTVTSQHVGTVFDYGVAVANTSAIAATITVEGAGMSQRTFEVPGKSLHREVLPWVLELKSCSLPTTNQCADQRPPGEARIVGDGAYHLRSTQPVTVYQFSPFDYALGDELSSTNDASLLLPTNVLTGNYVAAAWQVFERSVGLSPKLPGLVAVTAVEDDTDVVFTSTSAVPGVGGAPDFVAGAPTTISLNQGDVLQLLNDQGDLTGSVIAADKPVQVIGGHFCTNVPTNVQACDHLEDVMFPVETLSTEYIAAAPAIAPNDDPKEEFVRIISVRPGTTNVTYEPPIAGAPTVLAGVGDMIEIPNETADFVITTDQRVLVAQYMEGQNAGGGTGDPSLSLVVATAQYRNDYLFYAPLSYELNYVNITARLGSTVMLDDEPVTNFAPIGASDFGVARVRLGEGAGGNHTARSAAKFGISVYGYGHATSYWYPGGLDLTTIPID